MSYGTVAQLRIYLDQDAATLDATLQALLDRACSDINHELGFAFRDLSTGPSSITRPLDSEGDEYLYLPAPGAASITTVVENGVTLSSSLYEIDPINGKYLLRLDSSGYLTPWLSNTYLQQYGEAHFASSEFAPPRIGRQRLIRVTFVPNDAPAVLVQDELQEAVRLWKAKGGGFSDAVGVQGSNERIYSKSLLASTKRNIDTLKQRYGDSGGVAGA